jgi:hypothetical protein
MQNRSNKPVYILALVVGLLIAPVKLVYSFLPFFNFTDVGVFGVLAGLFGYFRPAKSWRWGLWLSIPTILLCLAFVRLLGSDNLLKGVGTGWAISVLVIPLAACLGSYFGARLARGRRLPK